MAKIITDGFILQFCFILSKDSTAVLEFCFSGTRGVSDFQVVSFGFCPVFFISLFRHSPSLHQYICFIALYSWELRGRHHLAFNVWNVFVQESTILLFDYNQTGTRKSVWWKKKLIFEIWDLSKKTFPETFLNIIKIKDRVLSAALPNIK